MRWVMLSTARSGTSAWVLLLPLAALVVGCPHSGSTAATGHPSSGPGHPASGSGLATGAATASTEPESIAVKPEPPSPPPPRGFEVAASAPGEHWPLEPRRTAISEGAAVLARHECTRCHEIDGLAGIGRPYDCVSCHVFLKGLKPGDRRYEKIAAKNGKEILDRYIKNIEHLMRVPNLTAFGKRVRPDWVAKFLAAPHDVRPVLAESMIRNKLTPEEIEKVVRYFAAVADVPDPYAEGWEPPKLPKRPSAARMREGFKAMGELGCSSCHALGRVDFKTDVNAAFLYSMKAESLLAPNLRFVRERVHPDVLVAWVVNPKSILPTTPMPKLEATVEQGEAIRDYLLFASPGKLPPPPPKGRLMKLPPAADHPVGWEEVKDRVLGKVCVHCHMNDHEKDTGPGNRGGFGYAGIQLSFRTYERAVHGAVDLEGKRYSVFETLPGEKMPRVLQSLLIRRVEGRRDHVEPFADTRLPGYDEGVLGMPLGLAAMTDEEIGIVRRWIEDGCPGPRGVSGRPGFTDGFLVPDGPIAKNEGCEVRAPSDPPPPWSSAPSVD